MARGGIKDNQLMAHKALSLATGLSGGARLVGAALLDHFNRRTGQCDPSHGRLADLLGIDERTVRDALSALCDESGADTGKLFERLRHGGMSHRTAYVPRWNRFDAILNEWSARMQQGTTRQKSAGLGAGATRQKKPVYGGQETRQKSAVSPGRFLPGNTAEITLQTRLSNPLNKPSGVSTRQSEPVDNTAIVDEGLTFQLSLRRLSDAVNALPDVEAKAALHGLPESVWKSATQATMKGQNGLAMLLDAAGIERAA